MIKVLSVDDQPMNHKVVSLDIEDFMEEKELEYKFHTANDGLEALKKIKVIKPKIIFMDMMMPHLTGTETIKCIKCLDNIDDPIIIMVTAIGDEKTKIAARKAGANGFISKPFRYEAVDALLSRYLHLEEDDNYEDGDFFFDFGEDDEFADGSVDDALGKMEHFNETHKKITSIEFLSEYSDLEINSILSDIDTLNHDILDLIAILYDENLDEQKNHIIEVLLAFGEFLDNFDEFNELNTTLSLIIKHLENKDYTQFNTKNRHKVSEFIKAILSDLINWKNHVFIEKDATDVYYINASMLNNSIQLEKIEIS
jgi:two-component system response regulator (stage 0 sporulation protein F)